MCYAAGVTQLSASSLQPSRPGLWRGIRCLFAGISWLLTTPSAWPFAMVPVVIALLLTGLLGTASVSWLPGWIEQLIGADSASRWSQWGARGVGIVAAVLGVVVGAVIAMSLAQPLSGPALEQLVRKREAALGMAAKPPTHFVADVWRSLQSLLVGYAFGLPAIALLLLLSLLVPGAAVVTVPGKLLVASLTFAWDLCDYPLSVRGLPVGQRVALVWRYRGAVLGFGAGMALAALIPCGALLLLPAGVAGGAQLIAEVEAYEAHTAN